MIGERLSHLRKRLLLMMERKGEYRGQKREIRLTAMMEREEERRNKERNEKKKGI